MHIHIDRLKSVNNRGDESFMFDRKAILCVFCLMIGFMAVTILFSLIYQMNLETNEIWRQSGSTEHAPTTFLFVLAVISGVISFLLFTIVVAGVAMNCVQWLKDWRFARRTGIPRKNFV